MAIATGSYAPAAQPERIFLTGIRVGYSEQNWVRLTMPDFKTWSQSLSQLPQSVVDRIHSTEFYETIRQQISERFLAYS